MKSILFVRCSPKVSGSDSGAFGQELVGRLKDVFGLSKVLERDLSATPIPHVSSQHTFASEVPESSRSAQDHEALQLSENLIEELEASDVLLIATPMHNFTVPSVLKAWIDHVVRAHRTIKLTPQGKVGLVGNKRTFIVVSSGGHHTSKPAWQPDFLTPYLTEILRTIGIIDVHFIYLEAMGHGPDAAEYARTIARTHVNEILTELSV
ncbi:MAG: FMN-dependent NADH-azoreductase [Nevskiaceae bacterium]|jgi:FMN-dependent NADH-azoreductase|nr:MAG: FMN-dependent NADH-azoreductase [Nevskiaceae bacterium]